MKDPVNEKGFLGEKKGNIKRSNWASGLPYSREDLHLFMAQSLSLWLTPLITCETWWEILGRNLIYKLKDGEKKDH